MRVLSLLLVLPLLLLGTGCSTPATFIQTDESYVPEPRPDDAPLLFRQDAIRRSHRVIGIIEAQLGRRATRDDLNDLLRQKAREVGADGVMLVEYGVDRDVYYTRHRAVVGPLGRTRVKRSGRRVDVQRLAIGTAVVFE